MLFLIASHLGCTVARLMRELSAQEFTQWGLWLRAERAGQRSDVLRHAELLAAVHNSGRVKPAQGGENALFNVEHFLPDDPWALPKAASGWAAMTPEQLKQLHDQHVAAEMAAMSRGVHG